MQHRDMVRPAFGCSSKAMADWRFVPTKSSHDSSQSQQLAASTDLLLLLPATLKPPTPKPEAQPLLSVTAIARGSSEDWAWLLRFWSTLTAGRFVMDPKKHMSISILWGYPYVSASF